MRWTRECYFISGWTSFNTDLLSQPATFRAEIIGTSCCISRCPTTAACSGRWRNWRRWCHHPRCTRYGIAAVWRRTASCVVPSRRHPACTARHRALWPGHRPGWQSPCHPADAMAGVHRPHRVPMAQGEVLPFAQSSPLAPLRGRCEAFSNRDTSQKEPPTKACTLRTDSICPWRVSS